MFNLIFILNKNSINNVKIYILLIYIILHIINNINIIQYFLLMDISLLTRVKQLEQSNESILSELWVATQEIRKLKDMNHQCLNWIEQQKIERQKLIDIIEQQNLEIKMLHCKL